MNRYHTSNLSLAIALKSRGFKYLNHERDKSEVTFVFEQDDELSQAVEQYWNGNLEINARDAEAARKFFNELIHSR